MEPIEKTTIFCEEMATFKDGYEGHWEEFDSSSMVFNTIVEAIYDQLNKSICFNFVM